MKLLLLDVTTLIIISSITHTHTHTHTLSDVQTEWLVGCELSEKPADEMDFPDVQVLRNPWNVPQPPAVPAWLSFARHHHHRRHGHAHPQVTA